MLSDETEYEPEGGVTKKTAQHEINYKSLRRDCLQKQFHLRTGQYLEEPM